MSTSGRKEGAGGGAQAPRYSAEREEPQNCSTKGLPRLDDHNAMSVLELDTGSL